MKFFGRLFCLLALVLGGTAILSAADYYVDALAGSDAAAGTTPESAWQSIDRVNNATLAPGDRVFFHCGQIWRGNLNAKDGEEGKPIYYGAFGEGKKPVILGSVDLTDPSAWIPPADPNGKIWTTRPDREGAPNNLQLTVDVGNIILTPKGKLPQNPEDRFEDDSARFAAGKRWGVDQLKTQNDYFYDAENQQIYYYSDQNPATLFDEMEAVKKGNIVNVSRYVTLENLACGYGASHGVQGINSRGCVIRGCDFFWIGGGHLYGDLARPTRYGNGVEFWETGEDHLVENCRFKEIYDVALTIQGPAKTVYRNITWRNNEIVRCGQALEMWLTDPDSALENVVFENNQCYDSGYGWSYEPRPDKNGTHLLAYNLKCKSIDVTIRDNLFYRGRNALIMFWNDRLGEFKIDHNTWIQLEENGVMGSEQPVFQWDLGGNPIKVAFEEYRKRTGNDGHSEFQSPPPAEEYAP